MKVSTIRSGERELKRKCVEIARPATRHLGRSPCLTFQSSYVQPSSGPKRKRIKLLMEQVGPVNGKSLGHHHSNCQENDAGTESNMDSTLGVGRNGIQRQRRGSIGSMSKCCVERTCFQVLDGLV